MINHLTPPYRLHLGCGRHVLDGYCNIDVQPSPKAKRPPDLLAPVTSIPLPDGCASEILAVHIFEHLYRWEAPKALSEWHRLLRPGGALILEMPDVVKCAKNLIRLIEGSDERALESQAMHGLYGDPGTEDAYMTHRYGWTSKTIKPVLAAGGFGKFKEAETQWHNTGKRHRDFRIEARRL